MKKIIKHFMIIISLFSLCLCAVITASSKENMNFRDVKKGSWYYDAVDYVFTNGIMNGTSQDKFSPSGSLSRAMYVTILGRLHGAAGEFDNPYNDVPQNAYYSEYVGWASQNGIVNGYDDGSFKGNNLITRQELMTMTARYLNYAWLNFDTDPEAPRSFADESKIASWAEDYVSAAREIGLVKGDNNGNFNPKSTATRAECATMIMRLRENILSYNKDGTVFGLDVKEFSVKCGSTYSSVSDEINLLKEKFSLSDSEKEHKIVLGVDESLMRLQYEMKEENGNLLINVSTKYALPYAARMLITESEARGRLSIKEGYDEKGTYVLDSVVGTDAAKLNYYAETNKNPLLYKSGDDTVFHIVLLSDNKVVSVPFFDVKINAEPSKAKYDTVDGYSGEIYYTYSGMKNPGAVAISVSLLNSKKIPISAFNSCIYHTSVIYDFDNVLTTKERPDDFDEFWNGQLKSLLDVEPEAEMFEVCSTYYKPGYITYCVKVNSKGDPSYCHITVPENAEKHSLKIKAWYSGYGDPDSTGVEYASDCICIDVNKHSVNNHGTDEYYAEMTKKIADVWGVSPDVPREDSYYLYMVLRDIQAIRFAEKQFSELWDGENIIVTGGSMGGFQSTAVASLYDKVTEALLSIPWMCDLYGNKTGARNPGWLVEYNEGTKYLDSTYFAPRFKGKVTVTGGLGDTTCPSGGVVSLYNAFSSASSKEITMVQGMEHGGGYSSDHYSCDNGSIGNNYVRDLKDKGCALETPKPREEKQVITESVKAMQAAIELYKTNVNKITITRGTSSELTTDDFEKLIYDALTEKCGLAGNTRIEIDEDDFETIRNDYGVMPNDSLYIARIPFRVYDKDNNWASGKVRIDINRHYE